MAWQVVANHGGGYSYRLCAADGALDDDCFRSGALNFSATRTHTLRWSDGETAEAPATLAVDRRGAEWRGAACRVDLSAPRSESFLRRRVVSRSFGAA